MRKLDDQSNASKAIQAVNDGMIAYCKFLSANDTSTTGAHQAGIYIAKSAIKILFDAPGERGKNKDRTVKIKWQDDFTTDSRFIYYGQGTRNEYRITRFNRGFPFLRPEHTGDLFVLVKVSEEDYYAYVLPTEEEINDFLNAFGMSPTDTGNLINKEWNRPEEKVADAIRNYIRDLKVDFPVSYEMAFVARSIHNDIYDHIEDITVAPDNKIISWINMEYQLFREIEFVRYGDFISKGFNSVEDFISLANMVLNRRKSRAGKSLEHSLAAIFDGNNMKYISQPRTEGNKRPDFLFPDENSYHDITFPAENLVFLGAKTTCKDRWRQIINEANRIGEKHLFTLQQGISAAQLDEMKEERVILVVPEPYIATFPREKRCDIWTLKKFIEYTKEKTDVGLRR